MKYPRSIMKAISTGFLMIFLLQGCSEDADSVVREIAAENEVHHEGIGIAGIESDQFRRYLRLSSSSTMEKLVTLTKHENLAVRCYAAWGLIDRNYEDLDVIFKKFLEETDEVDTFRGCIRSRDTISSVLYHRYWNSIDDSKKETDGLLLKLDHIVLNTPQADWLLIVRALENRKYPDEFNSQIEHLAFDQLNKDAIFYLLKWYPNDYETKARTSLISYLNKTAFMNTGASDYLRITSKLLASGDAEARQAVVSKLKADRHWTCDPESFIPLLQRYGIDESPSNADTEQVVPPNGP